LRVNLGISSKKWGDPLSVTVSIKVKKELVELADKMVKYGLAKSKSNAFNIMIEKGLKKVREEVEFWDHIHKKAEELKRKNVKLKHGKLNDILWEDRQR